MPKLPIVASADTILPGEAYLPDTPVLRAHTGTQPDLFLRWNGVPATAGTIDVVIHLHGFSQHGGAMALEEKVARSGLDLSRRARPTLGLIPRGNWRRRSWYDFPALNGGGLAALAEYGLACLRPGLVLDRLIVTAHSGGVMPALGIIAGGGRAPDELHLFDGLYGSDPALGDPYRDLAAIDRWLDRRFAAEPRRPGALRVVYLDRQTGEMSRAVGEAIARHLASADPARAALLSPRYRVERSLVPHSHVAWRCGPEFLADPGADIDWSRPVPAGG
ncbi:MAG: hypothetical protein ACREFB_12715 [Stellaceae bacterium]